MPAKLLSRLARVPRREIHCRLVGHRPIDDAQQREVDVEGVCNAPGPNPGPACAGRLTSPAFEHQLPGRSVLARLRSGHGVQAQGLAPPARFAEGNPIGQTFVVCSVEVDLELIAGLEGENLARRGRR